MKSVIILLLYIIASVTVIPLLIWLMLGLAVFSKPNDSRTNHRRWPSC